MRLASFLLSRKGYSEKKTIGTTGSSNGHNNNISHKNNDVFRKEAMEEKEKNNPSI